MVSPLFKINSSLPGVAYQATDGQAITLQLASAFGVNQVLWSFAGMSKVIALPTITLAGSPFGSSANFNMPNTSSAGINLIVSCTVNTGLTAGATDPSLTTTSAVYIVNTATGRIPFATGETFEIDPVLGWAGRLNNYLGLT